MGTRTLRWEARCASVAHGVLTHLSPGLVQDNGANDYENQARLSRFQGSQSISSSDYFGREESGGRGGGGGGGGVGGADFDVTAGELMSKLSVQVICWALSRTLASTLETTHQGAVLWCCLKRFRTGLSDCSFGS